MSRNLRFRKDCILQSLLTPRKYIKNIQNSHVIGRGIYLMTLVDKWVVVLSYNVIGIMQHEVHHNLMFLNHNIMFSITSHLSTKITLDHPSLQSFSLHQTEEKESTIKVLAYSNSWINQMKGGIRKSQQFVLACVELQKQSSNLS